MQIDQKLFMERVQSLEREAKARGSRIAPETIEEAFRDMACTDRQMEEICRYLEARQVSIEGREKPVDEDPSDQRIRTRESKRDQDMVRLYMDEMQSAFRFSRGQEEDLILRLCDGDDQARDLLVEGYLPLALEIAGAYRGKGLQHSDLIQECNLGLLMAISNYSEEALDYEPDRPSSADPARFREYLEEAICAHLEEELSDYTESMKSARKMVRQMNRLNDTAEAFARDYGRGASPEELADRMGMAVDEVRRLMKSSLDAIQVLETGRFDL